VALSVLHRNTQINCIYRLVSANAVRDVGDPRHEDAFLGVVHEPTETMGKYTSSLVQGGTVEIESVTVPYLDVRREPSDSVRYEIDRFIQEIARTAPLMVQGYGLMIAGPRPSDGLALSLATPEIILIVGGVVDPLRSVESVPQTTACDWAQQSH
jgi:hypothetical protein